MCEELGLQIRSHDSSYGNITVRSLLKVRSNKCKDQRIRFVHWDDSSVFMCRETHPQRSAGSGK